jgi:hypothetical protein
VEKPGFCRFFQELIPKPTGFWNKLNYKVFHAGVQRGEEDPEPGLK